MPGWHLYWLESDGLEDCFVVARNSRSAFRIESDMNGFDRDEVDVTRVLRIPETVEKSFARHCRKYPDKYTPWPWYAHRPLLKELGAQFRVIDGREEMLLEEVVYLWSGDCPTKDRSVGSRALKELRLDPVFSECDYDDHDAWDPSQLHLLTMIGVCLAMCQEIEHYIAHSFVLGISERQKRRYKTIDDLREGWKKKTLGSLLAAIDEAYEIQPLVRASFQLFLQMRNQLIHGLIKSDRYDIDTDWGRRELIAFLTFFDIVSRSVRRIFRSSFYASIDFGVEYLSKGRKIPRNLLTPDQIEQTDLFLHFFTPKEQ
jgi:hypothetical protein